jgi:hypothetical protein
MNVTMMVPIDVANLADSMAPPGGFSFAYMRMPCS